MSDWIIHIDGAARGNPGPAASAFVLERPGHAPIEQAELLGTATNNVAEYTALIHALQKAAELGGKRLRILSDSELMVKQIGGEYRVKNPELKVLYEKALDLIDGFESVSIRHVRREENARADALCNAALNAAKKAASPTTAKAPAHSSALEERVRTEAVACLEAAAKSWSRGNAGNPPPAAVWEQIWSVLEEANVLKKTARK